MAALGRQPGGNDGERARTPLARRFTARYAISIALFVALFLAGRVAMGVAIERVDQRTRQMEASAQQLARVDRIVQLSTDIDRAVSAGVTADAQIQVITRLQQEVAALKRTNEGLQRGASELQLPSVVQTPELADLYTGSGDLDRSVREVEAAGTAMASLAGGGESTAASRQVQIERITANRNRTVEGLSNAVGLYQDQVDQALAAQRDTMQLLVLGLVGVSAISIFGLFRPMAHQIQIETTQLEEAERNHRASSERQMFRNSLKETLEGTENDREVLDAVARAVADVVPDFKAELMLVDGSDTRLRRGQAVSPVGAPECPVSSPGACAAIRRTQTQVYESSRMLNVCPKLPEHPDGSCSAVCVPVAFKGRAIGVLHTTGADGHPPSHTQIERLTVLAAETGSQLGTMRVTEHRERQAATDGLTALPNRRTLEERTALLLEDGTPFSLAMADLDHFKDLNDTYGHEAGDNALKLFADCLRANLRPDDLPARYGGEEFIVVLPETNVIEARAALERLQESLAEEVAEGPTVPFTASWGLTDSAAGGSFAEMVAVADAALYQAKRAGRNCIMIDGEAARHHAELPVDEVWADHHPDGRPVAPSSPTSTV